MSNVTITIAGRDYTVACGDGEEGHIARLGSMIDQKLSKQGNVTGQTESRSLLFAALILADELHEISQAQPDRSDLHLRLNPASPSLEDTAQKLENLAERLESQLTSA